MRTRLTLAGAATATALLVAGCGGSSAPSTATLQRSDGPAPASSSPAAAAPSGSSAPEPAASSAATGAAAPAASAGTGGTAPQAVAAAPSAKADNDATAPGRYTYDSSGTVTAGKPQPVDGTATLTVDKPAGARQHSVLKSDQGSTTQDVEIRSAGTYLVRLAMTNPAFSKEFAPASPVLVMPDPATPGRSWSWTATSTDGKTTASLTARVVRTETVTVGGTATPTSVVDSTLKLTGDVTYTGQMQTWYDAAHRLQVKEHTKGSGTYGGIAFTTDITSVLRSTKPA